MSGVAIVGSAVTFANDSARLALAPLTPATPRSAALSVAASDSDCIPTTSMMISCERAVIVNSSSDRIRVVHAFQEQPVRRRGEAGSFSLARSEYRRDVRRCDASAADVDEGADDDAHHLMKKRVGGHPDLDEIAGAIDRDAGDRSLRSAARRRRRAKRR